RGVRGAAADGEVVALDDRTPPLDAALADDHVRRQERGELAVAVLGAPRQRAGLVKGVPVEEPVDPLAHGEPAAAVLPVDPLGAAHPARELLAAAQLLQLRLPAHEAAA